MMAACSHRGAQVYDQEAGEVYCGRCSEFIRVPSYDDAANQR